MAKKAKAKPRRHTLLFNLPGLENPVKLVLPLVYAKKPVTLDREEIDALNGIRGKSIECMNAQCGLRLRQRFDHDVFLIEFTDTRAYVVDRRDAQGLPARVVMYYHHQGDEQKEFDRPGGKQRLIKSGRATKTFQLLPPTRGVKHIRNPNPRPRVETKPRKSGPRKGSLARWIRSQEPEATVQA